MIKEIVNQAKSEIKNTNNLSELEIVRVRFLGKKGVLSQEKKKSVI